MKTWEKEEILTELYNYFNKKHYDENKDDEEIAELNQEIFNTLSLNEGDDNTGTVTVDGIDYRIIQDVDEAERIATEQVKNDLEEDPMLFNQEWLQNYLYIGETDKRCIIADEEDFIREMVTDFGLFSKDTENEEFENDDEKEKWIDEQVETRLKEFEKGLEAPVEYFVNEQGMYSIEDLMTQYWINIDIEEASKDAVQVDGWPHFLSLYDGSYEESENGLIIFRDC